MEKAPPTHTPSLKMYLFHVQEVQKESERFMMELQSHEKKAQEKATALVNHKHRMGQLAEELAAAIANEELSQPQVRITQ